MRNAKPTGHVAVVMGNPKRKYRIIIQERKSDTNKIEKCRSFMLYDYTGKSTIDKLKKKLIDKIIRFCK